MKITLFLHLSLSYFGGGEKWAVQVAQLLAQRGHEVEVHALPYTLNGRRVVEPREVLGGIPYCEGWWHSVKADVAYVFYNPLSWVNFRCGCPKIAGFHSQVYFIPKASLSYGLVPLSARWLYKVIGRPDVSRFEAVHVPNKTLNVKHRRIYYIPNWIDTSQFRPCSDKAERFRVLFVGRNIWQKGWDTFQKVALELRSRGYDFDFLYAGGDGDRIITGLGHVSEPRELAEQYSEAHVTVYPSRADVFSLVLVESLACGTPVITTPLVTHSSLDLPLFYARDVEGFIGEILCIHRLWRQRNGLYEEISSRCRRSSQRYDITQVFPRLEEMFRRVAEDA